MAAIPPPISKTAEKSDAGRNCPYCRFAFKQGVGLVVCGGCSAHHHQDCWADNGGCAVLGCAASPEAGAAATAVPSPAAVPAAAPVAGAAPAAIAPAAPRSSSSHLLAFGMIGLVVVAAIVVTTLALSGSLSEKSADDNGPTPSTPSERGPPPPPPPPPPPSASGVLANVARTCGSDGLQDCYVSLRSGPTSRSAERRRLDNGTAVRVVCQRRGERAYSSVLGAASNIWARTEDGEYLANVYLKGDGLNAFEITLPSCG